MHLPTLYLANLTHVRDGQRSSEFVPLNLGYLASFLTQNIEIPLQIELFNLPGELEKAISRKTPDILLTSSYIWAFELNYLYISLLKKEYPGLVTIMGGPHYPGTPEMQQEFLQEHNDLDFFVFEEGELTLADLVKRLFRSKFDISAVKNSVIPGCHFVDDQNRFINGGKGKRLKDLSILSSPYQEGWMDSFLEAGFAPLLQTNRGCPFTCAFCHSGQSYYNKIPKFSIDHVLSEIDYISDRVKSELLCICDDNFGIFARDKEFSEKFAELKLKTGWPLSVIVSTSKVNKGRVMDTIRPIGKGFPISVSLQSMNSDTLTEVERKNLTLDEFRTIMSDMSEGSYDSLTEFIVPMPNETLDSFIEGNKQVIDAGIDNICTYTSMLLPNTPLAEASYYDQFEQIRKYRIIPRNFGRYRNTTVVETEQVCVGTSTMSFDEYCETRGFHLIVNSYYNLKAFSELINYLRAIDVSVFEWIKNIHEKLLREKPPELYAIYDSFIQDSKDELWDSKEELISYCQGTGGYEELESGKVGSNLVMKYSAIAIANLEEFANFGAETLIESERSVDLKLLNELVRYSVGLRGDIFDKGKHRIVEQFECNILKWSSDSNEESRTPEMAVMEVEFVMPSNRIELIQNYTEQYGSTEDARGKLIGRLGFGNLHRTVNVKSAHYN